MISRYGRGEVRYGRGEVDAAASALRDDAEQAHRERAQRDPYDPDAAATPTLWSALAATRATRVITPEQYQRLGATPRRGR